MQIDHPYSLMVRDANLFWSCGQCPLDEQGQVQSPNDLLGQAKIVVDYVKKLLSEIHCDVASVGQLVVYYVPSSIDSDDGEILRELFHQCFGREVIVLTVAIPHFYYDGMMIEVDVFGSSEKKVYSSFSDHFTTSTLNVVDIGQLKWASLLVSSTASDGGGQSLKEATERLLRDAGLAFENLLSEQWFTANTDAVEQVRSMRGNELANPCQIVSIANDEFNVIGQFTFSSAPVLRESLPDTTDEDGVVVRLNRSSDLFEIMGMCSRADTEAGLVEQTQKIMHAIERTINNANLSFEHVRKVTTYYVGGASPEELHDNMSVRNRYYSKPGPASTGLPVYSFPLTAAKISIRVLGRSR